eukprot:sb/3473064/
MENYIKHRFKESLFWNVPFNFHLQNIIERFKNKSGGHCRVAQITTVVLICMIKLKTFVQKITSYDRPFYAILGICLTIFESHDELTVHVFIGLIENRWIYLSTNQNFRSIWLATWMPNVRSTSRATEIDPHIDIGLRSELLNRFTSRLLPLADNCL